MLIIGLTGGIGSGKTTVANYFAELGITIIDADIVAREVVKPNKFAYEKIIEYFGTNILSANQEIDRKKLREIIFSDANAKAWLEQLLHPLIRQEMNSQIKNAESPYIIMVIPLLVESLEPNPLVNRILVVDAPESIQVQRTSQRDSILSEQVQAIMNTQATREQRLMKADDIIVNDGDLNSLYEQVKSLHEQYLLLAR